MPSSGTSAAKNLEVIYSNLLKLYDLTLDRRKTLSGQAAGLLSFTGIIQTVFLGLLITLATSTQARETLLLAGQNHAAIVDLLATGFVTFMITIGLAFLAYSERKWVPAPEVLSGTDEKAWRSQLDEFNLKPDSIPVIGYEMQLMHGITDNNRINSYKYRILFVAYFFLAVSLFLMAIVGFYIIAGIA